MRLALGILLILAGTATAPSVRDLPLGELGSLRLELPPGWTLTAQGPKDPGGRAFDIKPPQGVQLELLITPLPMPDGLTPDRAAKEAATYAAKHFQPIAVEKEVPVLPLNASSAHGYYASATDKTVTHPSATSFRHGDQGFVAVGGVGLWFSIFSNEPDGRERAQALDIVRNAQVTPPQSPVIAGKGIVEIPAAQRSWALTLDLEGFRFDPIQMRDDGLGTKLWADRKADGMVVTAFIEPAEPGKTAVQYRESSWKTLQAPNTPVESDVQRSERGSTAILEYMVHESHGVKTEQKHMNAYMLHDGTWIDVHISKVNFVPSDMPKFEKILASIQFKERGSTP